MTRCKEIQQTNWSRDKANVGIVHLGYGAFHRTHQAVFIDDYMDATGDLNWGIAAINLRESESDEFEKARQAQDGYLLRTSAPNGSHKDRLVRAHLSFSDWARNPESAEQLVAMPSVHIISMTVTESGYYLNDDWSLNLNDKAIIAEVSGGARKTIYAYLAQALDARRRHCGASITVMCCDNIRSNGRMLERNFKKYLSLTGRDHLAIWVDEHVAFPNAMVDRITPRATYELEAEISYMWPDKVLSPIHSENFIQWVIEDNFASAFPDLTKSGAQIVDNVDPFEEAKIRILNGGHVGMCYLGALAGHLRFDEIMNDAELRLHFDCWETENVLPGLNFELPFDKKSYLAKISERFSNQAIGDQVERICMDGWSKMPIYIRPTLEACLEQGISPTYGYECVASWLVYARRVAAGTMPIPYHEPYWSSLEPFLPNGQEEAFASARALWADLPKTYEEFTPRLIQAIYEMEARWQT